MLRKIIFKSTKEEKKISLKEWCFNTLNESTNDAIGLKKHLNKKAPSYPTDRQCRGQAAENLAKAYLLKQGLVFLERNYHCRHGEIDLIFNDAMSIVFVEVRFRRRMDFGGACETIDAKKQTKIIKTAAYYLYKHRLSESVTGRFDVIGVTPSDTCSNKIALDVHNDRSITHDCDKKYHIEWIKNAFQTF
jgi:putative endonuclease